jgi:hypothetical protein
MKAWFEKGLHTYILTGLILYFISFIVLKLEIDINAAAISI